MAILKRGKKRKFGQKMKEAFWPTMGWLRLASYYKHRVFRTGDSTYKITAGLAAGGAVSWNPFIGTHWVQAVLLAWTLRASVVASFLGTAIGNPWTFPFMFYAAYTVGVFLCGPLGLDDFVALPPDSHFTENPVVFLKFLFDHPLKLLLPMALGGYLLGAICWFVMFGLLYYPIRVMRHAYQRYRLKRVYNKAGKGAGGFIRDKL